MHRPWKSRFRFDWHLAKAPVRLGGRVARWSGTAAAVVLAGAPVVRAADHMDGPQATTDPAADITDVFAWTSSDATHLNLVMDVFPGATVASQFSDAVQYVFHVGSRATFAAAASTEHVSDVICTFDASQMISCWAGGEYVTGDASALSGLSSADGKLKVFAGPREDPFFFNLAGFKATAASVAAEKGTMTRNLGGCPQINAATSASLVNELKTAPGGGPPQDAFAGKNVLSIAIVLDKTLVTQGGPIVTTWGATLK